VLPKQEHGAATCTTPALCKDSAHRGEATALGKPVQDLDLQMFMQQLLHKLSTNRYKSPICLAAQGKPY